MQRERQRERQTRAATLRLSYGEINNSDKSRGSKVPRNSIRFIQENMFVCRLSFTKSTNVSQQLLDRWRLKMVSEEPLHGDNQRVVLCLIALSLNKLLSSHSSCSTIPSDLSMDAENLRPSFFQRLMRSISCLRRRSLVSSLSQILHFCWSCEVVMTSLEPHVSPVRYSRLQCCLKWPHL